MPDTEIDNEPVQMDDSSQVAQDIQSELMDMIIADESPSTISDKIKDILYAKSSDKVDAYRPEVAQATFGDEQAATAAVADAAAHISGEVAAAQDAQAEE
jgi:hypothetical protein